MEVFKMRVLAFGAHPDDIEFRIAGTLAKMKKRGDEIFMCVATDGRIGSYNMSQDEIAALRKGEAQKSADLLGAELIWLGEPDEFLFDDKPTRLKFIEVVRYARPDVIFAPPAYSDYNQDHDITGYLAFQARVLATVKLIETEHGVIDHLPPLFYCTPHGINDKFKAEYFVDISDTFETKMKMFLCHESQQGSWCKDAFGVNYAEALERENRYYASVCGTPGVEFVEPFMLCKGWPIIAGAHKFLP
jgi:LmbE family N-acetylglucosaminyl deacetylase